MTEADNPRAVIGDNKAPDYAQRITEQMAADYAELENNVTAVLAETRATVPDRIETDADNEKVAIMMSRLRDVAKRIEAHRVSEKAPYLAGERAIDNFFGSLTDRPAKTMAIIQARGNEYVSRKVAAERAERQRLAVEAAERERAAREEADRLRQQQEELEAAAARARKPENIERLEDAAQDKGAQAAHVEVEALIAGDQSDLARNATLAKSADIARTKYASGHMATAKQIPHVVVTDYDLLPLEKLRPYLKRDEIDRAVKAFAKATSYREQIPGAEIGKKDAADYRG